MGMNPLEVRRRVAASMPHEVERSGSVVSFVTDVASALKVVASVDPVQAGSGDPSPENVRPISGWTGAHIGLTGKNLIPGGTDTNNGYIAHKLIKPDGTTSKSETVFVSEYFRVKPSTDYVYHYSTTSNASSVCFYDQAKNFIIGYKHGNKNNVSITTPLNAYFARATATYKDNGRPPMMFTEGTAFPTVDEWYTGQTYNISFPAGAGTVYGGKLTVNKDGSGELVVRDYYIKIDQNTSNLAFNSGTGQLRKTGLPYAMNNTLSHLCDQYTSYNGSFANLPNKRFIASSYSLAIKDTNYTSLQAWKDHLEEIGGIQFCLRILTASQPTYPLTPGQVKALMGVNNIWADTGNVTISNIWEH